MTQEKDEQISDRLNYSGSLEPVVGRLNAAYGIGTVKDFSVIGVGYEDCNVVVNTDDGKFVAKIFEKGRTSEDIARYREIMEAVMRAGVSHPRLFRTSSGDIVHTDNEANGISMVLMKFVEGTTFFDLKLAPEDKEVDRVIEEAAKINRVNVRPYQLTDSWAIPNIHTMFEKVKQFINPASMALVEEATRRYDAIPVDELPHCFVHGDIQKANTIKDDDGNIYIIDFSVANWYPRIQELAVISASLLDDPNNQIPLHKRTQLVADKYNHHSQLTPEERKYLYDYSLADFLAKLMGSHQERYLNGSNSPENDYWFNFGLEGLKRELS